MTTIKDVARLAGVAPSTVSNYLTGNARVSPPTAKRIQEAIDALGYIPNMAARSLRIRKTMTIGLIVPDIANPFFSEILRAINLASQRLEYAVMLCDSHNDGQREKKLLSTLLGQRVDGILMIPSGLRNDYEAIAESASRPIVFVDREVPGKRSVITDNVRGGRLAAEHLLSLGHRHIAVLAGDRHVRSVQERLKGFREALSDYGLSLEPEQVIHVTPALDAGRLVERLVTVSRPPTAIFATNDLLAIGAWRRLVEMSFRVPEDISLIGFDNIEMTRITVPALTTVGQDKTAIGKQAVEALLEAIAGNEPQDRTTRIPPQMVLRSSTAPVYDTQNARKATKFV